MKFVSFATSRAPERLGLFIDGAVVDLAIAGTKMNLSLPSTMGEFLQLGERGHDHTTCSGPASDLLSRCLRVPSARGHRPPQPRA